MKKIIFVVALCTISIFSDLQAQGLPPGACGIMFTYDATGSLIQREFICNTSGSTMFRTNGIEKSKSDSIAVSDENSTTKEEIVKVNAIMPNPTTGKFTVTLGSSLTNGKVILMDINGKIVEKKTTSGTTLSFNVSNQPAGIYFVRIDNEGKVFTFKVIKQ
ncbi:MAG: T9SS type A sorting domain-containing protein [Ginsengibacter sp.]